MVLGIRLGLGLGLGSGLVLGIRLGLGLGLGSGLVLGIRFADLPHEGRYYVGRQRRRRRRRRRAEVVRSEPRYVVAQDLRGKEARQVSRCGKLVGAAS